MFPYILALHILSFTAWMAGMFYLPRLFVYHASTCPGSELDRTFRLMERRLLRCIMTPAMILTWTSGLWLLQLAGFAPLKEGWLPAKLALVFLLSGLHGYFARSARLFARGQNPHGAAFWRVLNEAPTLLLIGIVLLVIIKPF